MAKVVDRIRNELSESEGNRKFTIPRTFQRRISSVELERFLRTKNAVTYNGKNVVIAYTDTLISQQDEACKFLLRFSRIVHLTPSELIELGKNNIAELESILEDFEKWLIRAYGNSSDKTISLLKPSMAKQMAKFVKGFLKANKVHVDRTIFKQIWNYQGDTDGTGYKPSKSEIKTFWSHADSRFKLFIQMVTNCPLRREELLELKWSDINLNEQYPTLVLHSDRLKGKGRGKYEKGVFAIVICESLRKELIKRKNEEMERFKTLGLQWNDDINLFLSGDNTLVNGTIPRLAYGTIGNLFAKLQDKANLPISCHSFRYYVESSIQIALGRDHVMLDLALGHKPQGTRASYGKVYEDKEQMRKWFKDLEPYLDLFIEPKKKEDLAIQTFRKALSEGKSPEEALKESLNEYKTFLLQDFGSMEEVLRSEMAKSEEEYERKYEE